MNFGCGEEDSGQDVSADAVDPESVVVVVVVVAIVVVVLQLLLLCNYFSQLYGEADPDQDVSPDTEDPEAAGKHLTHRRQTKLINFNTRLDLLPLQQRPMVQRGLKFKAVLQSNGQCVRPKGSTLGNALSHATACWCDARVQEPFQLNNHIQNLKSKWLKLKDCLELFM